MIQRLVQGRRCPNLMCTNQVQEGTWAIVAIGPKKENGITIVLDLCAPCADALEMATYGPEERT